MKPVVKVVLINCAILIIGVVFVDLLFGNWISYSSNIFFKKDPAARFTERYYETVFAMCPDERLHHIYCPDISHKRKMLPTDGGEVIVNFVNRSSIRVAGPDDMSAITDVPSYDVINIGDSFLQADEIPYEYTLSRVLEEATGKKVLQVGMGSWAPVNFYAWLNENELRKEVEVNMFVMTNDFLPNYGLSNLNYYRLGKIGKSGELEFDDFSFIWKIFGESDFSGKLKHALVMNSAVYRFLLRMSSKLKEKQPKKDFSSPRIFSDRLIEPITDCNHIKKYENIAVLTRDYVRLAFDSSCWNEELRKHVDSAIKDIRKSINEVNKVGGKMRIFVIPAAWAFEAEGVDGKTSDKYKMGESATITPEPLLEYIKMKLSDTQVEVVSVEKLIKNFKKQTNENFHFPTDGHWNKNAHKMLGTWLSETFY